MYSHPLVTQNAAMAAHRVAMGPGMPLLQPASHEEAFAPPEWVHLIPAGTFSGRDGRGPYTLDGDAVLAAFEAAAIDLPIDYEHQSMDAADKSGPVPAAGWIKALEKREDGLWAQVTWTPRAADLLINKEYRFLSPVFRYEPETGRVVALDGAGLTHTPNLHLKTAASQGDPMDELLEHLRHTFNLPTLATVDDILAEIDKLKAAAQAAQSREPDPAQYVPVAMHQQVAAELARLQAEIAAQRAEAAVSDAMRAGKLAPTQKDWALAYASRDAEGFAAFIAAQPVIVQPGEASSAPDKAAHAQLTESDLVAARLLGMSREAFAAAKQSIIEE